MKGEVAHYPESDGGKPEKPTIDKQIRKLKASREPANRLGEGGPGMKKQKTGRPETDWETLYKRTLGANDRGIKRFNKRNEYFRHSCEERVFGESEGSK